MPVDINPWFTVGAAAMRLRVCVASRGAAPAWPAMRLEVAGNVGRHIKGTSQQLRIAYPRASLVRSAITHIHIAC